MSLLPFLVAPAGTVLLLGALTAGVLLTRGSAPDADLGPGAAGGKPSPDTYAALFGVERRVSGAVREGPVPSKLVLMEALNPQRSARTFDLELAADRPEPNAVTAPQVTTLPKLSKARFLIKAKKHPEVPVVREAEYDRVVDQFILYDIGRLRGRAAQVALIRFYRLGPDSLPALLRGLNRAAGLSASCPVIVLTNKIRTLLASEKDLDVVASARDNIGQGVGDPQHQYLLNGLIRFCDSRLKSWEKSLPKRVPELVKALKDDDANVRRNAANLLARLGPKARAALPALVEGLRDADAGVRGLAARALLDLGPDAAPSVASALTGGPKPARDLAFLVLARIRPVTTGTVNSLVKALASKDAEVQGLAHWALAQLGAEAVPGLRQALGRKEVRGRAARVLGSIGAPAAAAVPALVQALDDPDKEFRVAAHHALVRIGAPAVPALCRALQDSRERVWYSAVIALGKIGPAARRAIPALRDAVTGRNQSLRVFAINTLRKIDPDNRVVVGHLGDAVAALREVLRHPDPLIRSWAAESLGSLKAAAAVPDLLQALQDADAGVRSRAAVALGQAGKAEDVVPALVKALRDAEGQVGRAAAAALEKFGRDAVPSLTAALGEKEAKVRGLATDILKRIGSAAGDAVAALGKAARDADARVRLGALRALRKIDPRAAVVLLVFLAGLKDPDAAVCREAREALAEAGKAAVPVLAAGLKEGNAVFRQKVLDVIRALGARAAEAVPAVIAAGRDRDPGVRWLALTTLTGIRPALPKALDAFRAGLQDPVKEVRQAARNGLRKAGKAAVPVLARALQTDAADRRCLVAEALKDFGADGREAVPALLGLRDDRDRRVRRGVLQALTEIDARDADVLRAFLDGLKDNDEEVHVAALQGLVRAGAVAIPVLARSLGRSEIAVRRGAIEAIKRIGLEGQARKEVLASAPSLFRALLDRDPEVSDGAGWALGELHPDLKAALPAVKEALAAPRKTAREEGVLPEKDLRYVSTARLVAASTREEGLRLREVLGELGHRRGEEVLVTLACAEAQKDEAVAEAARKALLDYLGYQPNPEEERRAASRLKLHKHLLEAGKKKAARDRLGELVRVYPRTRAAEEARTLLGRQRADAARP